MPVGIGTLPMWLQDVGSARTGRTPSDILKKFPKKAKSERTITIIPESGKGE